MDGRGKSISRQGEQCAYITVEIEMICSLRSVVYVGFGDTYHTLDAGPDCLQAVPISWLTDPRLGKMRCDWTL